MQTFLPFPDIVRSAACLDRQRLGKQRLEARQILDILMGKIDGGGWKNHAAVRMWRGYPNGLCMYGLAVANEWRQRGYKDRQWGEFTDRALELGLITELNWVHPPIVSEKSDRKFNEIVTVTISPDDMPPWFGDEVFHQSHRSNLVRKDPEHYRKYFPDVPDNIPYVWPVPP